MTEFEHFALDHMRHNHCMACGGCLLAPSYLVQSFPSWCVTCRDRIKAQMPKGARISIECLCDPSGADQMIEGWICPKCGSVYSPFVRKCSVCGPITVLTYSTTPDPARCSKCGGDKNLPGGTGCGREHYGSY